MIICNCVSPVSEAEWNSARSSSANPLSGTWITSTQSSSKCSVFFSSDFKEEWSFHTKRLVHVQYYSACKNSWTMALSEKISPFNGKATWGTGTVEFERCDTITLLMTIGQNISASAALILNIQFLIRLLWVPLLYGNAKRNLLKCLQISQGCSIRWPNS